MNQTTKNPKKAISILFSIAFAVFIVGYVIWNTRSIYTGIKLSVLGIENGKVYEEGFLEITGNATKSRHLKVNGREINIDSEGDFTDFLVLSPGYNIINISAEDKFGKITNQTFEVIRKEVL